MPNFNKVILCGHLTRDPELKFLTKGTAVCKLSLAVNRKWTTESGEKKEEVTFVEIGCFGKTAENIGKFFSKGRAILVEGRLKLDQWNDKSSGEKRQKLGVVLETFSFVDSKLDERPRSSTEDKPAAKTTANDAEASFGDDVPF